MVPLNVPEWPSCTLMCASRTCPALSDYPLLAGVIYLDSYVGKFFHIGTGTNSLVLSGLSVNSPPNGALDLLINHIQILCNVALECVGGVKFPQQSF